MHNNMAHGSANQVNVDPTTDSPLLAAIHPGWPRPGIGSNSQAHTRRPDIGFVRRAHLTSAPVPAARSWLPPQPASLAGPTEARIAPGMDPSLWPDRGCRGSRAGARLGAPWANHSSTTATVE
jgi:hypothetical protein